MQAITALKASSVSTAKPKKKWFDRAVLTMFLLSLGLVAFIAGAFVVEFQLPVYKKLLKPSFVGLRAYHEKETTDWSADGWSKPRENKSGTGAYLPELAENGVTLYTSMDKVASAVLISMTGEVLHKWQLPFRDVWQDPPHVARPVAEDLIHWRRAHLYPNGDLLVVYTAIDTPNGYGLVKLDKNSHVVWKLAEHIHHDLDIDASGNIYGLAQCIRRDEVDSAPHLSAPMIEDFVVVISPDGRETKRIPLFDAFAKSSFREVLDSIRSNGKGDHTHTNAIHLIPQGFAEKHPFCTAGDVMISMRHSGVLAIINLERGEVVWAARGIWDKQHDCDPLPNGNIMVFDNCGNRNGGGQSRVLEFDPTTQAIVWSYSGSETKPFESLLRGTQQQLPNGNLLVTESSNGRLFEITRNREIVWEYFNPVHKSKDSEEVGVVCDALRFKADDLPFLTPEQVTLAKLPGADRR
jgi:hypothetical protein